jgi:4-hydroxy-3-polyprenylbenzoate decarboxylase
MTHSGRSTLEDDEFRIREAAVTPERKDPAAHRLQAASPGEDGRASRPFPSDWPILVGVTGASGAIYPVRLLRALLLATRPVDLIFTEYGLYMLKLELGLRALNVGNLAPLIEHLGVEPAAWERVRVFRNHDLAAGPASGSSHLGAVVVCPCSMKNLAAIAHGLSETLLQRAADVALKEQRPLILVPRETPLNLIHLQNMVRVARAGATVLPAMPAFYQLPRSFEDLGDFVAARILDHLGIPNELVPRWDAEPSPTRDGRASRGAKRKEPADTDSVERTGSGAWTKPRGAGPTE